MEKAEGRDEGIRRRIRSRSADRPRPIARRSSIGWTTGAIERSVSSPRPPLAFWPRRLGFQLGHCRRVRGPKQTVELIEPAQGVADARQIFQGHFSRLLEPPQGRHGDTRAGGKRRLLKAKGNTSLADTSRQHALGGDRGKELELGTWHLINIVILS